MCGIAVSKQKVTEKCMQSLGTCLSLAHYILKIQLSIPIDHRVDSHKLQHRLFGVRSCVEDCCSEPSMSFAASQTCTHTCHLLLLESCHSLYQKDITETTLTFIESDL